MGPIGRATLAVGCLMCLGGLGGPALSQGAIPGFFDPAHRVEKPDLSSVKLIRFLTDDDYPPFNFALADGTLAGFNIDLARALCDELKIACTIQPRRFDTLTAALQEGRGDAVIASLAITAAAQHDLDFTAPYYRTPARFVARVGASNKAATPEGLAGETIGVVQGTAHAAYLQAYFPRVTARPYPDAQAARAALRNGDVGWLFGEGPGLAVWLNGTDAGGCCGFVGGPYTESRFFGEGAGIAVRRGNETLRRALDYGLRRLAERGVYADLYLKFFPIGFY